jgi:hypothetical protein
MLDHMCLQYLSSEAMQRRGKGGADGDNAAAKGCQTSGSEALRHPPVKLQPATHVDDRGQAEWHLDPWIERPRVEEGWCDPVRSSPWV